MKKLTTIAAAIAMFFSSAAFAAGFDPVSTEVSTAFLKKFSNAENVTWKKSGALYFANFQMEKNSFFAAFNDQAELVAISRTISISQVPLQLSQTLADNYKDYTVSNSVTEIVLEGVTAYYLTIENKSRVLSLKATASGDIEVLSKTKK
ncbi:MAG: hypothetical protein ABIW38_07155 [Ferruginibacter sp.]